MVWFCMGCKQEFRRFSKGEGVCPKCGFIPSYEADGYPDDEEILSYWSFRPVFNLRRWLRRRWKVTKRFFGGY